MSYDHKKALERIVALCAKSSNPTKRQERLYDIAMEGLGMTAGQREFELSKVRTEARRQQVERQAERDARRQDREAQVAARKVTREPWWSWRTALRAAGILGLLILIYADVQQADALEADRERAAALAAPQPQDYNYTTFRGKDR